jgi:hypothetical protein
MRCSVWAALTAKSDAEVGFAGPRRTEQDDHSASLAEEGAGVQAGLKAPTAITGLLSQSGGSRRHIACAKADKLRHRLTELGANAAPAPDR